MVARAAQGIRRGRRCRVQRFAARASVHAPLGAVTTRGRVPYAVQGRIARTSASRRPFAHGRETAGAATRIARVRGDRGGKWQQAARRVVYVVGSQGGKRTSGRPRSASVERANQGSVRSTPCLRCARRARTSCTGRCSPRETRKTRHGAVTRAGPGNSTRARGTGGTAPRAQCGCSAATSCAVQRRIVGQIAAACVGRATGAGDVMRGHRASRRACVCVVRVGGGELQGRVAGFEFVRGREEREDGRKRAAAR